MAHTVRARARVRSCYPGLPDYVTVWCSCGRHFRSPELHADHAAKEA